MSRKLGFSDWAAPFVPVRKISGIRGVGDGIEVAEYILSASSGLTVEVFFF